MIRVNNQYDVEWRPDMTVADVLQSLNFTFRLIIVRVNGELVRREDYAATHVPDGATVEALHLISGG